MALTIFFSWQSDRSTLGGRNLIERALEKAAGKIGADAGVEEAIRELAIDKDTKGVPGSPPIVETIFRKIEEAAVFVPDLTFVASRLDGRPSPNPNVLVEYGWALRALGHYRIVPVMNTAYGEPSGDAMPFDMRHLRNPIQYCCPDDADEQTRKEVREVLAKELDAALRRVLESDGFKASLPQPPEPPPFPVVQPKEGNARFRAVGEPIGYADDPLRDFVPGRGKGDGRILLSSGSAMWLRVMPVNAPGRDWKITELKNAMRSNDTFLAPLNSDRRSAFSFLRGQDGYGVYAHEEDDMTSMLAYAFTTGEAWTVDTSFLADAAPDQHLPFVEPCYCRAFDSITRFLSRLGVGEPFRWEAGMEGVKGRAFSFPTQRRGWQLLGGDGNVCAADAIIAYGTHISGVSAKQSLKPFFEVIFDKCGLERPSYLDSLGTAF